MRRGNLDSSGSEFHIHDNRVGDDWDAAVREERMRNELSMQMLSHNISPTTPPTSRYTPCTSDRPDAQQQPYHPT
jgi:hypothetical protein